VIPEFVPADEILIQLACATVDARFMDQRLSRTLTRFRDAECLALHHPGILALDGGLHLKGPVDVAADCGCHVRLGGLDFLEVAARACPIAIHEGIKMMEVCAAEPPPRR
jgi:hypothetical protein